jgi:hypothetical protein
MACTDVNFGPLKNSAKNVFFVVERESFCVGMRSVTDPRSLLDGRCPEPVFVASL